MLDVSVTIISLIGYYNNSYDFDYRTSTQIIPFHDDIYNSTNYYQHQNVWNCLYSKYHKFSLIDSNFPVIAKTGLHLVEYKSTITFSIFYFNEQRLLVRYDALRYTVNENYLLSQR